MDLKDAQPDSKFYSCIDTIQFVLVDFCQKITNLQFNDCPMILKNKTLADVFKYLNMEYREGFYFTSNFWKIVNKFHEIFPKYYNVEIDSIIENINDLLNKKLFKTYNDNYKDNSKSSEKINSSSENTFVDIKKKNNIFLEFIIKYIECARDILELMKMNMELFMRLQEIYKNSYEIIHNSNQIYDEEILKEVIEDYEKLLETSMIYLEDYSQSEYLQNTFFPLLLQIVEDINTIKSLLKSYKSFLQLDPINAISNLLTSRKNIENLKLKYPNIFDLKIYIFFIQFYIDNTHKANIIFKSYFDNKKLNLLQNFNEQKLKHHLPNDIHIKDEVFLFKDNFYVDKYLKKSFEDNLEISYFIIVFEKRKFLDFETFDMGEIQIRNFYINNNLMFVEQNEELGILSIFHSNEYNFKNILNEVDSYYKLRELKDNCKDVKDSNEFLKMNNNINNFSSFSQSLTRDVVYTKNKIQSTKDVIITHKISGFMFIAVKVKEKSQNDLNLINDLCKDFRVKFADLHLYKTLFNIK